MFISILQYSLLNRGRASGCHLHKIKTLENRFSRVRVFREKRCPLNVMYSEFGVLKLEDMLAMEYSKFLHRFSRNMLPDYFKIYLDDWGTVHQHNTDKKQNKTFFTLMLKLSGEKRDCNVQC